jgi:hypothetical protein
MLLIPQEMISGKADSEENPIMMDVVGLVGGQDQRRRQTVMAEGDESSIQI